MTPNFMEPEDKMIEDHSHAIAHVHDESCGHSDGAQEHNHGDSDAHDHGHHSSGHGNDDHGHGHDDHRDDYGHSSQEHGHDSVHGQDGAQAHAHKK